MSLRKSFSALVATVMLLCLVAVSESTTKLLQVEAFSPTLGRAAGSPAAVTSSTTSTSLNVLGKKKPQEDLSFIESRDMTREEMLELNKKNEDIMNMELQAMTGFSLVLSLPILYLCWVAFFSD